ncbi:MAG: N-acetylmannosamine-6-phosphate 2-epimerase [Anaerolineae bacterium]|nr:N-acetylmannosamine-6-phosphate 2-epimerase [Anaerolineae bacterium]
MSDGEHLPAVIARLRGGLIVSCQALPHEPLHGSAIMARMALAAWQGGAVGIRANTPEDIRAIRAAVPLPLIGIYKDGDADVYITPTLEHARAVARAGADIVALDATGRPRPDGRTLAATIAALHAEFAVPVMADISTCEEGLAAVEAGADLVSTTLSGYTPYSPQRPEPDLALVAALAGRLAVPVIAEGRISTPALARAALEAGAFAVVVGAAITRPQWITAQFAAALTRR